MQVRKHVIKLKYTMFTTVIVVLFDRVLSPPPCKVCGSTKMKKNDLKIDWFWGRWKGEWTCENDHRNTIRYKA